MRGSRSWIEGFRYDGCWVKYRLSLLGHKKMEQSCWFGVDFERTKHREALSALMMMMIEFPVAFWRSRYIKRLLSSEPRHFPFLPPEPCAVVLESIAVEDDPIEGLTPIRSTVCLYGSEFRIFALS